MSGTIYYLKPEFKMQALLVPLILLVPIGFIIGHIVKGDADNFQNKDLENTIIMKHENKIIETEDDSGDDSDDEDEDNWDITEYMNDKYNELKNYIKKINVINNDNGNKSINVRYNIE
jgi:hypothetical protein